MTDIPPPRYKVVEHKGRITVTDTWADGGRPNAVKPRSPIPTPRISGESWLARLRVKLVTYACVGRMDGNGRNMLQTTAFFDAKGPRTIGLNAGGVVRLGNALVGFLAAVIVTMALLFIAPVMGFVALGIFGLSITRANTTGRPTITKWLDRLGDDAAD